MTVIKAIFFDLDGTLVNTHDANYLAYKDAIQDTLNITVGSDLKDYIKQGMSSDEFIPKVAPQVTKEDVAAINTRKKSTYRQHVDKTVLNEYLATFLKQLSPTVTTALVTTAKRHNAEAVLSAHDLHPHFSFCIYGDDVESMKPHPEAYITALEKAGVEAHEAIAFEDSDKGVLAAEAAGIIVIRIQDFEA